MIPIKNLYYMLSYAFQNLKENGYKKFAEEEFENAADLLAAILIKGVSIQLKQGLARDYIVETEPLTKLLGKIEIGESIRTNSMQKMQLVCSYDEYSSNTKMNRILKATMSLLLGADIEPERKKDLKKLLIYFNGFDSISLNRIDWHFRFNKNNQSYRFLMSICNLVVDGLLQTQEDGSRRLMDFLDEQRMCRLYEKFILEYYVKHYRYLSPASVSLKWPVENGYEELLPEMRTDVTLTKGDKVLIIDAKYYTRSMQVYHDKHTIHSANLYQLFTYVKSKEFEMQKIPHEESGMQKMPYEVSGMLLYAKTDDIHQPDPKEPYLMSGNKIMVRTLDLNCDFDQVKKQLDDIIKELF